MRIFPFLQGFKPDLVSAWDIFCKIMFYHWFHQSNQIKALVVSCIAPAERCPSARCFFISLSPLHQESLLLIVLLLGDTALLPKPKQPPKFYDFVRFGNFGSSCVFSDNGDSLHPALTLTHILLGPLRCWYATYIFREAFLTKWNEIFKIADYLTILTNRTTFTDPGKTHLASTKSWLQDLRGRSEGSHTYRESLARAPSSLTWVRRSPKPVGQVPPDDFQLTK